MSWGGLICVLGRIGVEMITWKNPEAGVGWIIALVILICVWAGFMFGRIDLPLAFVVSAICAVRL
jgi:hypothetical protein